MKNDWIPYGKQRVSKKDIENVVRVLKSEYLTQGPEVEIFERSVTQKTKAKYGVAFNSATSALHIACKALGLGKGDWLWTSPITFVASANCGRYCRANVDFVDINLKDGLMNIKKLERKLEEAEKNGKLPKIVIPVHLAGTSCDMKKIKQLSKKYKFKIIEDASHAIGGSYNNEKVGNCKYSDICIFSFHPVKIITTAEGGLATTNDKLLEQKMKDLRSHGIIKEKERMHNKDAKPWMYEQHELGYNYRMTDIQAALGTSQLKRLNSIVEERNKIYNIYSKMLANSEVKLLKIPKNTISSVHLAVIHVEGGAEKHRRVFENFRRKRIGVQIHYTPVHLQPYYRNLGFKEGDFMQAEKYAIKAISIPVYPGLKEIEQRMIIDILWEGMK